MGVFSGDDRDVHLVTRGNVDGIVSAALFLGAYPRSRISFVTSPTAGAKALSRDRVSSCVYLVDLAIVPELARIVAERSDAQEIVAIDHHQPLEPPDDIGEVMIVKEGMSAAGVLYQHLQSRARMRKLVAIADLMEFYETPVLRSEEQLFGRRRLEEEAKILDFSWRLNIEDDLFRLKASSHLSRGCWPSQVGIVKRRYLQVLNERRWPRALARVESSMRIDGQVCILEFKEKNRSLHGFGTRALVEVARDHGCGYAVMINQRKDNSSVSLRALATPSVNLGRFVEGFTSVHGLGGGGHPTSAGARIPTEVTPRFVDEFQALVAPQAPPFH